MNFFKRMGRKAVTKVEVSRADGALDDATRTHLEEFVSTRRGVEAWVEEASGINKPSLLLVAHDGEYTRRAVGSTAWAFEFAARHDVPAYQAGVVGYPQRMRDYDARRRLEQRRAQQSPDEN